MRVAWMLAALCIAGAAQAADGTFYVGGGVTRNRYDLSGTLDNRDGGFKVIAGVRLHPVLDIEVSHSDHGRATLPAGVACYQLADEACPDTSHVDARSTSVFGVAKVGGQLALIGKGGITFSQSRLRSPGQPDFGEQDSSVRLEWGLGLQATIGRLLFRGEFETLHIIRTRKLQIAALDILYAF